MIHTRPSNANYLMVMLIDLDNFKALNDTHGHKAGDQALVHTARTLSATADPRVVIARIGGEEFLLATTAPTCTAVTRHPTLYSHRYHSRTSHSQHRSCAPASIAPRQPITTYSSKNSSRPPTRQCIQQNATAATKSITPTTRTRNSAQFGAHQTGN